MVRKWAKKEGVSVPNDKKIASAIVASLSMLNEKQANDNGRYKAHVDSAAAGNYAPETILDFLGEDSRFSENFLNGIKKHAPQLIREMPTNKR